MPASASTGVVLSQVNPTLCQPARFGFLAPPLDPSSLSVSLSFPRCTPPSSVSATSTFFRFYRSDINPSIFSSLGEGTHQIIRTSVLSAQQNWFRIKAKPVQEMDLQYMQGAADMIMSASKELQRYAVVTGSNKGIGLETVRQLAMSGVTVVLTARDEKRGLESVASLNELGLSNVIFHLLDVLNPDSIASLAEFIEKQFGRLDILVNNAGASGVVVDEDGLRALNIDPATWLSGKATNLVQDVIKTTAEKAEECLNTNYYGCKRMAEALLPLLKRSPTGANIVNVSSLRAELRRVPNEQIRNILADVDTLTEEKIDRIVDKFLHDLKEGAIEANGWQKMLPAYSVSKVALNAYTRVLAKQYPEMRINCVHPGYVNTDLNWHTGPLTVEEGAKGSVMLALLQAGGPTGCYFDRTSVAEF